jgi:threonine aldolase
MIDFSSDTQTLPSRAMRTAVLDAPTGDERHDACPTTTALCRRVAELFQMEAAVFLPSGTMCNEIAIAVHTDPGDEVICARESHIIFAESGGPAALSGVMMHPLDADRGLLDPDQVEGAVRPASSFAPRSRLLVTEQTSNLGGGAVWPVDRLNACAARAKALGLRTHLDGARVLNASVATGVPAADYARHHDSAWIAFTKGLGCPVGAVLAGSRDFIDRAWLLKRRWGGAMRQTGVLTAMCLYALDHHVDRLADDHALAQRIAEGIADAPVVDRVWRVETNILVVDLPKGGPSASDVQARLRAAGVKVGKIGTGKLRILTHLDVGPEDGEALIRAVRELRVR